jgi:hypothetical protein
MTVADLETLNTAYATAVDAEDWAAALKVLTKIAVRTITSPSKVARSLGGAGNQSVEWSAEFVAQQQAFCRKMQAAARTASGFLQQVPIAYQRAGETGDYT